MSIILDKPEQISMWVMLSRRHQVQLHLKGLKVKGIMTALKRDFGDHGRYVKDYIVPIEFAISEAGGEVDYRLVNAHVMIRDEVGLRDAGIFNHPDEAKSPETLEAFKNGTLEMVLTLEEPRESNDNYYV